MGIIGWIVAADGTRERVVRMEARRMIGGGKVKKNSVEREKSKKKEKKSDFFLQAEDGIRGISV